MDITVEYDREEVQTLCIKATEIQFGKAPDGKEWVATGSYGEIKVELVDRETPIPIAAIAPSEKEL